MPTVWSIKCCLTIMGPLHGVQQSDSSPAGTASQRLTDIPATTPTATVPHPTKPAHPVQPVLPGSHSGSGAGSGHTTSSAAAEHLEAAADSSSDGCCWSEDCQLSTSTGSTSIAPTNNGSVPLSQGSSQPPAVGQHSTIKTLPAENHGVTEATPHLSTLTRPHGSQQVPSSAKQNSTRTQSSVKVSKNSVGGGGQENLSDSKQSDLSCLCQITTFSCVCVFSTCICPLCCV